MDVLKGLGKQAVQDRKNRSNDVSVDKVAVKRDIYSSSCEQIPQNDAPHITFCDKITHTLRHSRNIVDEAD